MKLRYVGPHDAVELSINPPVIVERGGVVDVADAVVAAGLLLQDVWESAPDKPTTKES